MPNASRSEPMRSRAHWLAAYAFAMAGLTASTPAPAQRDPAQTYPSRSIRLIVPFAAGGGADLAARAIAQLLTEAWGQSVVVDNRAGANGTIGVEIAARSPPDGYTLTVISASHSVNVNLYKDLPYDLVRDFAPITQTTTQPYVLVVNSALPVRSVGDLIAMAKARPNSLNYGSSGIGGLSHLSGALFATQANIQLTHIPYKGGSPALQDVVGGQIEMLFSTLLQSHAHIAAGKLRALAVTTATRSPAAAQLPTMIEAGMPGFVVAGWYGILAPAGTPAGIVAKLNREIVRILRTPEVREKLASDGSEPVGSTPEEFAAHIKSEIAKWHKVVSEANIKAE
jgi:tripartite-type tricarboxylate transporter receptor subunit TctC